MLCETVFLLPQIWIHVVGGHKWHASQSDFFVHFSVVFFLSQLMFFSCQFPFCLFICLHHFAYCGQHTDNFGCSVSLWNNIYIYYNLSIMPFLQFIQVFAVLIAIITYTKYHHHHILSAMMVVDGYAMMLKRKSAIFVFWLFWGEFFKQRTYRYLSGETHRNMLTAD